MGRSSLLVVYRHTLAYHADLGTVARLLHAGLADPGAAAFGERLWAWGAKVDCRRCHCEVLRWHECNVFCSERCRNLWMISHPQDLAAGALIVGTQALVRAGALRLRG